METKVDELKDTWDGTNGIGLRTTLNKLIKEFPDLIEAYNFRHQILHMEDNLVAMDREAKRAYQAVVDHFFPDDLPEKMEWIYLENRPILKALYNYAICCWVPREVEKTKEIFEKMLRMNPNDNQGCRFCLLGIYECMTPHHFFHEIDQTEMLGWFQERCVEYHLLEPYRQ